MRWQIDLEFGGQPVEASEPAGVSPRSMEDQQGLAGAASDKLDLGSVQFEGSNFRIGHFFLLTPPLSVGGDLKRHP
jgi:hypothetical protein